jgi:hypothetical protein
MKVRNPLELFRTTCGQAHANLINLETRYAHAPRQRHLMLASATITAGLLVLTTSAHADGIADMATTAATQGDSIKASIGKLFAAGGFGGAGFGGYNWWRKGKEGEQSHIKGSQVMVPILAGAALGAIGFVMIKAGETVGIQGSAQGQLPA